MSGTKLDITHIPALHPGQYRPLLYVVSFLVSGTKLDITHIPALHPGQYRPLLYVVSFLVSGTKLDITHIPALHPGQYRPLLYFVSFLVSGTKLDITDIPALHGGGGGVDPIPCVSTHRISDPRSGPAQLLPPHVKQRSHPHGVCPQIPDR